jgi:hypothetical protein
LMPHLQTASIALQEGTRRRDALVFDTFHFL